MPDHVRNLEEWVIWLLADEFHQSATIDMIVQRTGYPQEDVLAAISALERAKAITVYRNAQQATIIDRIRIVSGGMRTYEELKKKLERPCPERRPSGQPGRGRHEANDQGN